jgi:hypothetical protein
LETPAVTFFNGQAWLTRVTMQGDAGSSVAMKISNHANVYAQGMGVAQFPFHEPSSSGKGLKMSVGQAVIVS